MDEELTWVKIYQPDSMLHCALVVSPYVWMMSFQVGGGGGWGGGWGTLTFISGEQRVYLMKNRDMAVSTDRVITYNFSFRAL